MEMVIDASAILATLLNEPERGGIMVATRGSSLVAPASIPYEIGNALSALLRRAAIGGVEAHMVWHGFARVPIRFVEVDIPAALTISAASGLYAYDAYLIACAESLRCPLLTLDRRLGSAASARGVPLVEVR